MAEPQLGLNTPPGGGLRFQKRGLTICEVPGEGDGPFAAEHPPDLGGESNQEVAHISARKQFYVCTYYLFDIKRRTLPLLLCIWWFRFLGKELGIISDRIRTSATD